MSKYVCFFPKFGSRTQNSLYKRDTVFNDSLSSLLFRLEGRNELLFTEWCDYKI